MNGVLAKKQRNGFGNVVVVFCLCFDRLFSGAQRIGNKERSDFKTHLQILDCGETGSALTRVHNTVRRI